MRLRPATRRSQMIRMAVCLGILTLATTISLRQPAPDQFEVQEKPGSWKWWLAPVEENAIFRPVTTRAELQSVFFLPGQNQPGWTVGLGGAILHTENGGRSWQVQSSGTTEGLLSVTFATVQSGWAVGWKGTILHTENGGRSWQAQSSGINEDLWDVTFATPQSGWAVGRSGTILHTENGGSSWQPQSSGTKENLSSVTFATPQSGWAVGWSGTILHTDNGGSSWQPQKSGTTEYLSSVTFATPQSGWAVGRNGIILHTENGGSSWRPQSSGTKENLSSVTFATPQSGWAVGGNGSILHTENGGSSWQTQNRETIEPLVSVTFATPQSGWAVGWNGTTLHTENGGSNWQPQSSGTMDYVLSVTFATPQSGWAVGTRGTILHTENGGSSWQLQSSGTKENLYSVTFATPQSGWAVGESGTILHTENGGSSWQSQSSGTAENLLSVTFATPQLGWAVGTSGTILRTENGGSSWQHQSSGTIEFLLSVTFATPQSGWAVGDRGTILHTDNGGSSWQPQSRGTKEPLSSVTFATPQSGWAVGARTILHTENGGISWKPMIQYRRWPAPWYYAALLFCVIGLFWASLKVRPANFQYVEDVANSDNPVTHLQGDVLGYRSMVLRLSRFIQNPNTAAPLVLSIQAPWGMGKSSVMRMLQSELQHKRAAATVWFNAWHHQKEDQLLAYLLEAIQKQIAPSWFSAVGLGFRFNLLRVRMLDSVERFLAVLAALALFIFHSNIAGVLAARLAPWTGHKPETLSLFIVLSFAAGILLNQMRAFSADPQKLLDSSTKSAWRFLRDLLLFPSLQGKTDVRQEFEKNLREVTDALRPQRLVIFLDDLDRCRPEQVVQILEAINFLSSAAPCFIVLGADYSKVETLAGMQFEQIALQEQQNAGVEKPEPSKTRLAYARSYMKKIVNIRVNLPRPATESWQKFLIQPAEHHTDTLMRWQQGLVAAVLLLCASAVVAQALGWIPAAASASQEQETTKLPDRSLPSESTSGAKPATTTNAAGGTSQPPEQKKTDQERTLQNGDEDRNLVGTLWSKRLTISAVSLIALVFLVIVFRRPREPEKAMDSKDFADALKEVAQYVYRRTRTPREMRRFLNYLRLVAAPDDPENVHAPMIQEAALVRLAAMGTHTTEETTDAVRLFQERCDLFGLDPNTFTPKDEKEEDESNQAVSMEDGRNWKTANPS